jgi:hypothetical protein
MMSRAHFQSVRRAMWQTVDRKFNAVGLPARNETNDKRANASLSLGYRSFFESIVLRCECEGPLSRDNRQRRRPCVSISEIVPRGTIPRSPWLLIRRSRGHSGMGDTLCRVCYAAPRCPLQRAYICRPRWVGLALAVSGSTCDESLGPFSSSPSSDNSVIDR